MQEIIQQLMELAESDDVLLNDDRNTNINIISNIITNDIEEFDEFGRIKNKK